MRLQHFPRQAGGQGAQHGIVHPAEYHAIPPPHHGQELQQEIRPVVDKLVDCCSRDDQHSAGNNRHGVISARLSRKQGGFAEPLVLSHHAENRFPALGAGHAEAQYSLFNAEQRIGHGPERIKLLTPAKQSAAGMLAQRSIELRAQYSWFVLGPVFVQLPMSLIRL
jgi:hypothetical protein